MEVWVVSTGSWGVEFVMVSELNAHVELVVLVESHRVYLVVSRARCLGIGNAFASLVSAEAPGSCFVLSEASSWVVGVWTWRNHLGHGA